MVAVVLAAVSTACGFAAVAVSLWAGDPLQGTAAAIYAACGGCAGAGCALVQAMLSRTPPPLPAERPPAQASSFALALAAARRDHARGRHVASQVPPAGSEPATAPNAADAAVGA